ncbi:tax1-binding protein 3 isoform X2 [Lates calcarifer]|uniref:Tax1-binding protein 3 isoform X2 n=1 Tax=Lates calcarifer TaxID=8187 RepID=A0AAJ8BJ64_LATCA|nr:tax1-binding protein 3 isoform X2 [Lates calcarifer]
MAFIPGQPVTAVVQRIEIQKLRQGDNLILGFSIGGGIDQDPGQNPFSEDKTDKPFTDILAILAFSSNAGVRRSLACESASEPSSKELLIFGTQSWLSMWQNSQAHFFSPVEAQW